MTIASHCNIIVFTYAAVSLALEFKQVIELFDFSNEYFKLASQHLIDSLSVE